MMVILMETPNASQVTPLGTKNNPGFRIFEVDSNTYKLFADYHHYRADLEAQGILHNQSPLSIPKFELVYSAKKAYGLTDMSAQQWYELSQRFLEDADDLYRFYLIQQYSGHTAHGKLTHESRSHDVCLMRYGFTDDQIKKHC